MLTKNLVEDTIDALTVEEFLTHSTLNATTSSAISPAMSSCTSMSSTKSPARAEIPEGAADGNGVGAFGGSTDSGGFAEDSEVGASPRWRRRTAWNSSNDKDMAFTKIHRHYEPRRAMAQLGFLGPISKPYLT